MGTHQKLAGAIGIDLERTPQWDPFRSADDDYAVLEWMLVRAEQYPEEWEGFKDYFREVRQDWNIWNYKLGLFARAACVVLEIEDD